ASTSRTSCWFFSASCRLRSSSCALCCRSERYRRKPPASAAESTARPPAVATATPRTVLLRRAIRARTVPAARDPPRKVLQVCAALRERLLDRRGDRRRLGHSRERLAHLAIAADQHRHRQVRDPPEGAGPTEHLLPADEDRERVLVEV